VTFALIQELIQRDALRVALAGRDDVTLEPILSFLIRHVTDPRFGEIASEVAGVIIGKFVQHDSAGVFAEARSVHASFRPNALNRRIARKDTNKSRARTGFPKGADEAARSTGHDVGAGRFRFFSCTFVLTISRR